ncbi:MAG: sulfate adenylyltransferase subunit CysD [Planctomycetota bacterium]|jgi:sulfate adenylyltransferase subunit 2
MDYLDELESKSIYIIREAYSRFRKIALLWSIGKDSTALLWMVRKAFFGEIPIPVIHIDTGYKFKAIYDFRDTYARKWGLDLRIAKNQKAIDAGMGPDRGAKLECCGALKTQALKDHLREGGYKAVLLGIRRDEHGIRAKERYFSPRDEDFKWDYENQPPELWDQFKSGEGEEDHVRVHPLLHMTELDIWRYVGREEIPITDLYFAKKGKRYRSIGCETCCSPAASDADTVEKVIAELETTKGGERAGRAQDKEDAYMMQKLRSLGYM